MMRPFSFGKLVLTLGTLALLASSAWAQGRGGFGGGGAGFLMAPNVQKDLNLCALLLGVGHKIPSVPFELPEYRQQMYGRPAVKLP